MERFGYKSDIILKKDLFLSKILIKNSFRIPYCKRIKIIFPLYEVENSLRSKSIIILLEFLEQISGIRAIIKNAHMIVTKGLWVRGQVDLSGFPFMNFFIFFNEYFIVHPLLRFSSQLPFLRINSKNSVKLIISNIEMFFDTSIKRILPYSNDYWLEMNFYFENSFSLKYEKNILFYTQFFFSNHFLEWRNI
jgi:hypothetical protein